MHKSRSILQKIPPLRLAVYLISAALFIAMAVIAVRQGMAGWPEEGPAVVLGNAALWLVPFVLQPLLRRCIGDSLWLLFVVFAFFASFLGTVMRFYENIWWYDLAMHTVFGYIGCLIGLFFACKLADIYTMRPLFIALFCFCVSLMFAAMWEVFEFTGDLLLGNNAQGDPVQTVTGELFIPVNDTMEDIICNTAGAILFLLHYGLHRLSRRSLGFYMFMKDFSIGKRPSPASFTPAADGETPAAAQSVPEKLSPAQTTAAAMRDAPSEAPAGADLAPAGLLPLQEAPAKAHAESAAPQKSQYTEEK